MNIEKIEVEAIALYGSMARGDCDIISDRDVLLVDSRIKTLCDAENKLKKIGFSCTKYTWKKLEAMSRKQGLFLQHIKQEGVIIKESQCSLSNVLSLYNPSLNYSSDIELTKELIATTQAISRSKESLGWALDVLAVAVRNIGILMLANHGIYVFSFYEILKKLYKLDYLTNEELRLLYTLRIYKNFYRKKYWNHLPDKKILEQIQGTVSKCFKIDFDSRCYKSDKLIAMHLNRSSKVTNKYQSFRLLESCFIELRNKAQKFEEILVVKKVEKIIKNQNHYGLFFNNLAQPLRANIDQLMNML